MPWGAIQNAPGLRVPSDPAMLVHIVLKTPPTQGLRYSYEEFADHMKAMKTVREWEYTSRFGHLGNAQTSRANSARVVEYFSDSYEDPKEALHKAERFLCIYDYIGRHADLFARKRLIEKLQGSFFSVDPALLRAVHFGFTAAEHPASISPKKIFHLAKAFQEIDPAV
jgi:hypothetical protein